MSMRKNFVGLFQGIIIGAGAILPGISGAALAVVFGVYEDFMDLVAHPIRNVRGFIKTRAFLCIGIAAGFVSFTVLLDKLFSAHVILFVFLFSGFIAGTLPDIWIRARKHGVGMKETLAFILSAGLLLALAFSYQGKTPNLATGEIQSTTATHATARIPQPANTKAPHEKLSDGTPNLPIFVFAGAIIGAGSLLPGISASFILIYLGLYAQLLDAAAKLELPVGLAIAIGAIMAVMILSRLVAWLYHRFHGVVSFAVLGFTIGSLVVVFPGIPEPSRIIPCAALAIAAFIASFLLARIQN